MLRFKIAIAVAIIKACPAGFTPEAFASHLCSNRCLQIAESVRRENQLKAESIHLRQKLLDRSLKMDEILILKRRGRKRKKETDKCNDIQVDDIHGEMLDKIKTEYLHDMEEIFHSKSFDFQDKPVTAFQFLKHFLFLKEQSTIDTRMTPFSEDGKLLSSVSAIDSIIGDIFWTEESLKSEINISLALAVDSLKKIFETVGRMVDTLTLINLPQRNTKRLVQNMLGRITDKMKLFLWNLIRCSDFELVDASWRGMLDKLLLISKCGSTMKCCLIRALVQVVSMVSCHVRTTAGSGPTLLYADACPQIMENSAKIFFCLEGALALPPREDGGQSDQMRMLNAESKKLLNHSLIHTVERYPLFALRVWEVGGLLSEFQWQ